MYTCVHSCVLVRESEASFQALVFSFYCVDAGGQTSIDRLSWKLFYRLSIVMGPGQIQQWSSAADFILSEEKRTLG